MTARPGRMTGLGVLAAAVILGCGPGTATLMVSLAAGPGTDDDGPGRVVRPRAPDGVSVHLGDTELTLEWLPVKGATSYNIYWDTSPGVSKLMGTPIPGVTSGHVHTGLTNGMTYYYCVTAVTPYGESSESAEVSAIPDLSGASVIIDGNPVAFTVSYHYYDGGMDISGIYLAGSSPPGWTIDLWWNYDVNPGCPCDTCWDFLLVDITSPSGGWYWEEVCVHDVVLCITQYASTPGGTTSGTFSGEVVNTDPPYDVLTLTGGQFTVPRQ